MSGAISSVIILLAIGSITAAAGKSLGDTLIKNNVRRLDEELNRLDIRLNELHRRLENNSLQTGIIDEYRRRVEEIRRWGQNISDTDTSSLTVEQSHDLIDAYADNMSNLNKTIRQIEHESFLIEKRRTECMNRIEAQKKNIASHYEILESVIEFTRGLASRYDLPEPDQTLFNEYRKQAGELEGREPETDVSRLEKYAEACDSLLEQLEKTCACYSEIKENYLRQASERQQNDVIEQGKAVERKRQLEFEQEQLKIRNEKIRMEQKFNAELAEQKNLSLGVLHEASLFAFEKSVEDEISEKIAAVKKFDNIEFAHNYYQTVALPFFKQCRRKFEEHNKIIDDYILLQPQYLILCRAMEVPEQDFPRNAEGLAMMKDEIRQLEIRFEKRLGVDYVNRIIDDSMRELGYDVIGDKTRTNRRGEMVHQKLVTFSDKSALHFTMTENGQMTMEVVGLDQTDRKPTEQESQRLKKDMLSFCKKYPGIREALEKKGIRLEDGSILPADEQFAKIINTSGFTRENSRAESSGRIQTAPEQKARTLDDGAV